MRALSLRIALPTLAALLAATAWAATEISAQEVSVEDLRNKPWQTWNQLELAYGFAHYDEIVPAGWFERGAMCARWSKDHLCRDSPKVAQEPVRSSSS